MSVFGSTFADEDLDLTGNIPVVIPHKPLTLSATWAGAQPALDGETDAQYFADPQHLLARGHGSYRAQHRPRMGVQGRRRLQFRPDDSFLKRLKFGARYADRQETVRYTTYNWGRSSEVWAGSSPVFMSQTPASNVSLYHFNELLPRRRPQDRRQAIITMAI